MEVGAAAAAEAREAGPGEDRDQPEEGDAPHERLERGGAGIAPECSTLSPRVWGERAWSGRGQSAPARMRGRVIRRPVVAPALAGVAGRAERGPRVHHHVARRRHVDRIRPHDHPRRGHIHARRRSVVDGRRRRVVRRSRRRVDHRRRGHHRTAVEDADPAQDLIEHGKRAEPEGRVRGRAGEGQRWNKDRGSENQRDQLFHGVASCRGHGCRPVHRMRRKRGSARLRVARWLSGGTPPIISEIRSLNLADPRGLPYHVRP